MNDDAMTHGCLLENDPSIISAEVLSDDGVKYEASGDQKYVEKPITVVNWDGMSESTSKLFRITAARTWPRFGPELDGRCQ